ncbi:MULTISPECIES: type II toxin-antitoxin system VapB family antitoxin [Rhizobium]|uniref:Arc/MetJ family transcription regulator n=1 Tax=Rhizobium esperanzae TaxID=1967781 RepID=A0A7W6UNF1_9HYPH|nr:MULTISPECIES: type II toxin-antitoxin system VapB family antitoxin [Rhizobium]MBB4441418.1 Arc/MetJ family transcription regulator [Rhizobium esperanzae]MDH6204366.1 Arc/MetJ family transcription regulator [Rhizobium leguminosarum]
MIDDALLDAAMTAAGLATKKATVEQALRNLVEKHRRKNAIADLAGIGWEANRRGTSRPVGYKVIGVGNSIR